jgi:hypothetical protein
MSAESMQGLKPNLLIMSGSAARLKSCPDTSALPSSFSAACKAQVFYIGLCGGTGVASVILIFVDVGSYSIAKPDSAAAAGGAGRASAGRISGWRAGGTVDRAA